MGSFLYWSHLRVFCTRIRLSQSDIKKVCNMTAGEVVWGLMIKKHPAPLQSWKESVRPLFWVSLCSACVFSRFSCVQLLVILWTVICQPPLSTGFPRQEYWSRLPRLPPGDLPDAGIELTALASPALAGGFFTTSTTWEVLGLPVIWRRAGLY